SDISWLRTEYRTDLFSHDQISDMLDHYIELLGCIADHPEVRLSQLDRPSHWLATKLRPGRQDVSDRRKTSTAATVPSLGAITDPTERHSGVRDQSDDRLEATLAELWSKVLGAYPPTATTNFFDVGGHSLMAVRLASEIGRAYGTNFPVSLLFQAPTIEGMARRLRAQVGSASSVIAVQEHGSLPPFFCGGSMREIVDLSRALGSDQPFFQLDVFALQRHRFFVSEPPYASVPDLAACFRRDILSTQPLGPYYLGGMCEGGIIALEIALQLQEEGREVALLAEFDTPVNGYWRKRSIDRFRHGWSLILSRRLILRLHDHVRPRTTTPMHRSPQEEAYAHITSVTWEAIRTYSP